MLRLLAESLSDCRGNIFGAAKSGPGKREHQEVDQGSNRNLVQVGCRSHRGGRDRIFVPGAGGDEHGQLEQQC